MMRSDSEAQAMVAWSSVREERNVFPIDSRQLLKFDEINSAFTSFDFRKERLRLADLLADSRLSQASVETSLL